ncbi:YhgE/Pip family protein [Lactiplantibacillus pentosus]|nr:YhgE/Pip family protein [Lactiplantibacillus pentosus]MDC6397492.1 YhgE/Pip family protein [Lactiplantibacillus pentosus]
MKMIRDEWRSIRHSKILWISVSVMILIPFLYSIFFLKSVWDPYGDTQNLPVAVVNQDKSVNYQGQKFAVGKQMVTNLKKNDDLEWHFVSAKQAQQGLKNRKYYTVVTIPSDFSKNATTMTDTHPKKMNLHYETNESLNYIAKVITDTGVSRVNKSIRAEVTKAYALAIFKKIRTAGDGYQKAADGATKLKDGGVELQDGLTTYTTGVHTLKDGTTELNTKVQQLPAGIAKLADGGSALKTGLDTLNSKTGTLASGVSQLKDGSGQVTNGLGTLNGKTGALASATSQLAKGSQQVAVGVVTYTNGVYELSTGIQQLDSKTGQLTGGVKKLTTGSTALVDGTKEYSGYVAQVAAGADQLNKSVQPVTQMGTELDSTVSQLATGAGITQSSLEKLQTKSQDLSSGLTTLYKQSNSSENKENLAKLQAGMGQMQQQVNKMAELQTSLKPLATLLSDMQKQVNLLSKQDSNTDNSNLTEQINQKIDSLKDSQNLSDAQVAALKSSLAEVKSSSTDTSQAETIKALASDMTQLSAMLGTISQQLGNQDSTSMKASATQLNEGIGTLAKNIQNSNDALETLSQGAQQLPGSIGTLNEKVVEPLTDGINAFGNKVPAIKGQLSQLTAGTSLLAQKSAEVSAGSVKVIGGAEQLNTGLSTLNQSVPTLVGGIQQLNAGGNQLVSNSASLRNGTSQIANGNAALNAQVPQLVSGVSQLFNGSKQVTGGLQTLNGQVPALVSGVQQLDTGAGQLNSGLQTLQGSTGQLTSGVSQLNDGATQLDNNSAKLLSGTKQLKDGNKTLATSLQEGADQVNATPLKNANAKMMAAPTKTSYKDYTHVPNYGHALAPYVLSLALYVGAIVFNFAYPIRRIADDDGTPTQWFWSKVAVGGPVALAMAVIEATVLLVAGLKPISVPEYYLTAIMIAFASMFLVMFLSMLFDNPGRFVAMVILMLQLGGSGGTFPMEITNKFFNVIHPYLPLTYSIQAFRQALTGGWGNGIFWSSIIVLAGITIVSLGLLWASMVFLKQHDMQEPAEAEIQMKAGK